MKELRITTKIAFALLGLIKKMEIKEDLVKVSKEQIKLTAKKDNLFKELYSRHENKDEDITQEVAIKLLNEHIDIAKAVSEIDISLNDIGINFAFNIIEKLPGVEKEFYKTMSVVYGIKASEVEEKEIDEVIDMIITIFRSKSFQGLLGKMNK